MLFYYVEAKDWEHSTKGLLDMAILMSRNIDQSFCTTSPSKKRRGRV